MTNREGRRRQHRRHKARTKARRKLYAKWLVTKRQIDDRRAAESLFEREQIKATFLGGPLDGSWQVIPWCDHWAVVEQQALPPVFDPNAEPWKLPPVIQHTYYRHTQISVMVHGQRVDLCWIFRHSSFPPASADQSAQRLLASDEVQALKYKLYRARGL